MGLESQEVEKIYASKVAGKYDFSMPPFFARWKKKAYDESSLSAGNKVLVFCCGTGLDFPPILEKIGEDGKIIGVDFSPVMLEQAGEKIRKKKWKNVELLEGDITKFENKLDEKADVGVCTLGMSIIPRFKTAFYNLLSNVKDNGEVIIGDMQLASGWLACLNPVTIFLSKKFGGTYEGHKNSLELYALAENEMTEVKKREFFFKSYYYCIGKRKPR